jgi:hypothetical protein
MQTGTTVNVIPGEVDETALKRAVLSAAFLAAMSQVRVNGKALTGPKARELANDAAAQIFPDLELPVDRADGAPAYSSDGLLAGSVVDLGELDADFDRTVDRCAGAILAAVRTCNTIGSRRALVYKLEKFLEVARVSDDGALELVAIAPLANTEQPARPSAADPRD